MSFLVVGMLGVIAILIAVVVVLYRVNRSAAQEVGEMLQALAEIRADIQAVELESRHLLEQLARQDQILKRNAAEKEELRNVLRAKQVQLEEFLESDVAAAEWGAGAIPDAVTARLHLQPVVTDQNGGADAAKHVAAALADATAQGQHQR